MALDAESNRGKGHQTRVASEVMRVEWRQRRVASEVTRGQWRVTSDEKCKSNTEDEMQKSTARDEK